jgi:acyl-CoA synthetase (AMP-forming)/AMP-acid ligase II
VNYTKTTPLPIGLTETSIIASCTSFHDVWHGSSGSLVPDYEVRIVGPNDEEITGYGEPGEVLFRADNLFIGYLGNEEATKKTFDADGWMRTGDVGMVRVSPNGNEHLFIVDRIKDMIKVKVCLAPLTLLPCL